MKSFLLQGEGHLVFDIIKQIEEREELELNHTCYYELFQMMPKVYNKEVYEMLGLENPQDMDVKLKFS